MEEAKRFLTRGASGLGRFRTLVDFERLLDTGLLMHDGADGADHAGRTVRLEDISSHIDADGAGTHRVEGEFQRLHLRRLFAAGDDDGNRAALDLFVELLGMVSLNNM